MDSHIQSVTGWLRGREIMVKEHDSGCLVHGSWEAEQGKRVRAEGLEVGSEVILL